MTNDDAAILLLELMALGELVGVCELFKRADSRSWVNETSQDRWSYSPPIRPGQMTPLLAYLEGLGLVERIVHGNLTRWRRIP